MPTGQHPPDPPDPPHTPDPPDHVIVRARDLTPSEFAALSRMDVHRRVWHPRAGWGTVGGWFGIPPAIGPMVAWDDAELGPVMGVAPWNLVYPS